MPLEKARSHEPKFIVGEKVTLIPVIHEVEETLWHSGAHGGHYSYKLSNGNWYFEDEIIPY